MFRVYITGGTVVVSATRHSFDMTLFILVHLLIERLGDQVGNSQQALDIGQGWHTIGDADDGPTSFAGFERCLLHYRFKLLDREIGQQRILRDAAPQREVGSDQFPGLGQGGIALRRARHALHAIDTAIGQRFQQLLDRSARVHQQDFSLFVQQFRRFAVTGGQVLL